MTRPPAPLRRREQLPAFQQGVEFLLHPLGRLATPGGCVGQEVRDDGAGIVGVVLIVDGVQRAHGVEVGLRRVIHDLPVGADFTRNGGQ